MSSIPSPAASSDADDRSSGASSPSGFIFRAGVAAHKAQAALVVPRSPTEQDLQKTQEQQHFVSQLSAPQPAPRSMGPLSAEVKIPPRPKPGRKPMTTEGEGGEKRKAQNRNAQRRFRDKRQQKLEDQVEVNDGLRQELQKANINFESRLNAVRLQNQSEVQLLQQQIERQQQEISRLQAALDKADERERSYPLRILSSRRNDSVSSHAHARAIESVSTPPDDNEIDFTNYGRSMGTEDKCGFCGTGDTCPCAQSAAAAAAAAPVIVTPLSRQTGPGTCDQCQNDPTGERARACRELAANSTRGTIAPLTSRFVGRRTVPCGTVVDAFQSARAEPSSISTLFGGQRMQAYAAESGGFDYEHAEAAKVLVQLNERIVRKDSGRHEF